MPKFAAVQMESTTGDLKTNYECMTTRLRTAARHGAEVVVFPEVALTGYDLTPELAGRVADSLPDAWIERMAESCAQMGTRVCFGMVERGKDGLLYNTAALVGPDGLIGAYRKLHLPFMGADRHLTPGDRFYGPFDTADGALGIQICYDLRFPESTRALALRGAQVVLVPTALPATATIFPEVLNRARAAENRVYIISANHIGEEGGSTYMGRSQIIGPDGGVLTEAGPEEEAILYAELDLAEADRKKLIFRPGEYELDLFGARRPELYGDLVNRQ